MLFQVTLAPPASYQRDQFVDLPDKAVTVSAVEANEEGAVPTIDSSLDGSMARGLEANLAGTAGKGDDRDRVIGVMFDRTLKEQLTSSWFL